MEGRRRIYSQTKHAREVRLLGRPERFPLGLVVRVNYKMILRRDNMNECEAARRTFDEAGQVCIAFDVAEVARRKQGLDGLKRRILGKARNKRNN